MNKTTMTEFTCQNCGYTGPEDEFDAANNIVLRIKIGDPFTNLECRECGALAYPTEVETEAGAGPEGLTLTDITNRSVDMLEDPSASIWLKTALSAAFSRDPVDAANDAEILSGFLSWRAGAIAQAKTTAPCPA